MKKNLLFSAFFLSLSCCYSQITITQSDMPAPGDTLRVSFSSDTLDPALTGANHTWNYASLKSTAQWLNRFDSPSTFVFPFNLMFSVLNTSYGLKQYTPDSIPGAGFKTDNAYGFYKKSSTSLKEIGYGLTINSLPVPFSYSPADVVYKFPLQYGSKDSCDSKFAPAIPIGYYYGQNIHRVNEVDGWGTLITPYGTFQTVRVKSTVAIRDTFADTSGVGFAFSRPLQYEYKWLTQGGKIPYLQVNASNIGGFPVVTRIAYRDSMRGVMQVGIHEQMAFDLGLQVFPNPANEYAVIQYTLDHSGDIKIELLDISGKSAGVFVNTKQISGAHLEIIDLRDLNLKNGTYFLCVYVNGHKAIEKLVLAR